MTPVRRVERAAIELGVRPIPTSALALLGAWNAPPRLVAHLYLVHDVAAELVEGIRRFVPDLSLDAQAVRFGAATHDIGKAFHPDELTGPGKRHEAAGERRLLEEGIEPSLARFARTHGLPFDAVELDLADLLVITSDKIWKGKRIAGLEERVAAELASEAGSDYWSCWLESSEVLDGLTRDADRRLEWQGRFGVE